MVWHLFKHRDNFTFTFYCAQLHWFINYLYQAESKM